MVNLCCYFVVESWQSYGVKKSSSINEPLFLALKLKKIVPVSFRSKKGTNGTRFLNCPAVVTSVKLGSDGASSCGGTGSRLLCEPSMKAGP